MLEHVAYYSRKYFTNMFGKTLTLAAQCPPKLAGKIKLNTMTRPPHHNPSHGTPASRGGGSGGMCGELKVWRRSMECAAPQTPQVASVAGKTSAGTGRNCNTH